MRSIGIFSASSCFALALASAQPIATPLPPPDGASAAKPKIEFCPVDPKWFAIAAYRKGSTYTALTTKGNANCSVEDDGTILVVSATSNEDAMCEFELFIPAHARTQIVIRIGAKAGPGSGTKYYQRVSDPSKGIKLLLDAKKSETRQFRLVGIEVDPVNSSCGKAFIEGAI